MLLYNAHVPEMNEKEHPISVRQHSDLNELILLFPNDL